MYQSIHRRHQLLKQGSGIISDLSDVTITNPQDGEVMVYSNGVWVNLADFALALSSPAEGQILVYDSASSTWVNQVNEGGYPPQLGHAGI